MKINRKNTPDRMEKSKAGLCYAVGQKWLKQNKIGLERIDLESTSL